MSEKQRTLKGVVKLKGIGLHTGVVANLEIHPAPANHGYKFQRIDLEGKPVIKADVDRVISTERGTTLEQMMHGCILQSMYWQLFMVVK